MFSSRIGVEAPRTVNYPVSTVKSPNSDAPGLDKLKAGHGGGLDTVKVIL